MTLAEVIVRYRQMGISHATNMRTRQGSVFGRTVARAAELWLRGGRVVIQFCHLGFLVCEFELVVAGHPI